MSFYFIEIDQKLNWSLNSNLEEELSSRLGGLRFGVDAEGNYGYKKAGADTVVPFKSTEEFNMFALHSCANNSYYCVLPASLFKNYKISFPSRYNTGDSIIYGIKGEYDFSKVQNAYEIPNKTLIWTVGTSNILQVFEFPEGYDYFAFWYDTMRTSPTPAKLGIEFKFIPK